MSQKKSCVQCGACDRLWAEVSRWMDGGGGAKGVQQRRVEQYAGRSQGVSRLKPVGNPKGSGTTKTRGYEYTDVFDTHTGAIQTEKGNLGKALAKYEAECKDDDHKKRREKERQRARKLANPKTVPTEKGRSRFRRWQARDAFSKGIGPEGIGAPASRAVPGTIPKGPPLFRRGGGGGGCGGGMIKWVVPWA